MWLHFSFSLYKTAIENATARRKRKSGYMNNSKSDVRWAGWELSEVDSRRISSSSWSDTNHSDSEPPMSLRCTNCCCSCCSKTYPEPGQTKIVNKTRIKVHHSYRRNIQDKLHYCCCCYHGIRRIEGGERKRVQQAESLNKQHILYRMPSARYKNNTCRSGTSHTW